MLVWCSAHLPLLRRCRFRLRFCALFRGGTLCEWCALNTVTFEVRKMRLSQRQETNLETVNGKRQSQAQHRGGD